MKKLTLFFSLLMLACIGFQACDDTMTYAEMKEREDDAVAAFIRDSSITVISQSQFFAQDTTTNLDRNEYVQLVSGVYMQIVDRGVEGDTIRNNDEILVRFTEYNILDKYLVYSNLEFSYMEDSFRYTESSSSIAGIFMPSSYYYSYFGSTAVPAGWLVPWDYIYDKARVKLIVPSDMGSSTAMSSVIPYYYDIRYQIY